MKIGFTGTQSTGKTTLAKLISEQYDIPYIGNISRRIKSEGLPINTEGSDYSQMRIFSEHFYILAQENFVSDRSVLDAMAYTIYNNKHGDTISDAVVNIGKTIIDECASKYDFLFYLPAEDCPLVDDGVRSMDNEFRNEIDTIIKDLILPYDNVHVITGTIEQRMEKINDIMRYEK